jgi:glycosyltransferase involved in cell wall biosynthesis
MHPAPPRLAVLLCTYNDAARLPRALDAILAQSRPADEIVVVDDGSIDATAAVLTRYAAGHARLRVVTLPRNGGVVAAGLRGLGEVTAEFVYWASANDYVLPEFFARAMELAARHPQAGALLGQAAFESSRDGTRGLQEVRAWRDARHYAPAEFLRDYLGGEDIWFSLGPACIYRRAALAEAGGFRPELGAFCDSFAVRVMGLTHGVCYLPQPCANYFTGAKSYSDRLYRNPPALLAVVARAAALMREPPLAAVCPADYVARWEQQCRAAVGPHLVHTFEEKLWEARSLVTEDPFRSAPAPFLSRWAFRVLGSALHHLGRRILLRRHGG